MWYMTPERKHLQNIVKDFAEKEIRPFIPRMENDEYPSDIIKGLGRIGILGLCHDKECGGYGADYINWYMALEEISKVSPTVGLLACQTSQLCARMSSKVCTPEQIEKYIKPAVKGDTILGQYATEACGMVSLAEFQTTAVRDGDDWIINGSKIFSTNAGECDYAMVVCRTNDNPDPVTMRGASMFLVHKDNPGYTVGHIENKFGMHGSSTGQTYFNDCRVPADALIGEVDGCIPFLVEQLNAELGFYAALNLGAAEAVFEKTKTFVEGRLQAGKSLWDSHQVVRYQMAEMWMQIEMLRGALYGCAEMQNKGLDTTTLAISLKVKGTEIAKSICDTCMTMHGGLGTVYETGIERYYRDVKMFDLACGSNFTMVDVLSSLI